MALEYPADLPGQFRNHIVAEQAKAESRYFKSSAEITSLGGTSSSYLVAGIDYITDVTLACAEQVREGARRGLLRPEQIADLVEGFAASVIGHAYADLSLYRYWEDWPEFKDAAWSGLRQSDGWHAHLHSVARLVADEPHPAHGGPQGRAEPTSSSSTHIEAPESVKDTDRKLEEDSPGPSTLEKGDNRTRVNAYIDEVFKKTGLQLTRTQIWKDAGYKARTEFDRWQRNDKRTTKKARATFDRVLRTKPRLKNVP